MAVQFFSECGHWPTNDPDWCDYYHMLDKKFDTMTRSPLHHNNRCPIHGRG